MIDQRWNSDCHVIAVVRLRSSFGLRCLTGGVQSIMNHMLEINAPAEGFGDIGVAYDRPGFSSPSFSFLSWSLEMNAASPSNFETYSLFGANSYSLTESSSTSSDSTARPIEGNGS